MASRFPGFPPEAIGFLRALKKNNQREWFLERKSVYEEKVREPMLDLAASVSEKMETFAPEFQIDAKKAVYRIYRDVRFSKDKSPYKTHVAAVFPPRGLPKHAGAGFYFHIDPKEILIGGGVYAPGPKELLAIRRHLSEGCDEYRAIISGREFRRLFGEVRGERLKRVPKGFSPDDRAADLITAKQFLAASSLPPKTAETSRLETEILKRFRALAEWIRFLNAPLLDS